MACYPREFEHTVTLSNGTQILIRPIRPEDSAMEQAFVQGLSPASRYFRFLDTIKSLSAPMLKHFTEIDYDRHMAIIAVRDRDGEPEEIGVTRYVVTEPADTCEFAIVVADAWQGLGLGRILLQTLIEIARRRGLRSMFGDVLGSNRRMLDFVAKLGFRTDADAGDVSVRRVTLDLGAATINP